MRIQNKRRRILSQLQSLAHEGRQLATWKGTFLDAVSGSMMPPGVLVGAMSFSTSTRFNRGITRLVVDIVLFVRPQCGTVSYRKREQVWSSATLPRLVTAMYTSSTQTLRKLVADIVVCVQLWCRICGHIALLLHPEAAGRCIVAASSVSCSRLP